MIHSPQSAVAGPLAAGPGDSISVLGSPVLFGALCGTGVAIGILLLAAAWRRPDPDDSDPVDAAGTQSSPRPGGRDRLRWAACAAAGVLVGVTTGWLVAGVLAAIGAATLPALLGPDRGHAARMARTEAVATWTESLRDTLSAAAGLQQALAATAGIAPAPIRPYTRAMAARLAAGQRPAEALSRLAAELADPVADRVAAALIMAADRHGQHLTELLGSLAVAARGQAAVQARIAASRARIRTAVRVICGATLGFIATLVVTNRAYLDPYDTLIGQLILAVVGGLFAVAFVWLGRLARGADSPRLLTNPAALAGHRGGVRG